MLDNYIESKEEEWANVITHGLGVVLSIAVLVYFLCSSVKIGATPIKFSIYLFTFSLLAVYGSSTCYHLVSIFKPRLKKIFQQIDHMSIYFLIAGTQTPFILLYLNNRTGIIYLWIIWSLVLLGVLFKFFFMGRWEKLSVAFYLMLGWLAFLVIPGMKDMNQIVFLWIIIGGLSYSFGVIFYRWRRLKYNHCIWHIFVLLGSISHFISIFLAL